MEHIENQLLLQRVRPERDKPPPPNTPTPERARSFGATVGGGVGGGVGLGLGLGAGGGGVGGGGVGGGGDGGGDGGSGGGLGEGSSPSMNAARHDTVAVDRAPFDLVEYEKEVPDCKADMN